MRGPGISFRHLPPLGHILSEGVRPVSHHSGNAGQQELNNSCPGAAEGDSTSLPSTHTLEGQLSKRKLGGNEKKSHS